ncbi:hypothetical protein E1301_Tti011711 [Triplophysa tibetana]|uniref:Uncharacterized protein n=1 Tax=Triplophysa tibetana TaxID=1572043 RepID=A0A5A9PDH8_9TELE|nr:hypothetical protein E1301_Tti011711 [Triplophysa tibetana]
MCICYIYKCKKASRLRVSRESGALRSRTVNVTDLPAPHPKVYIGKHVCDIRTNICILNAGFQHIRRFLNSAAFVHC